MTTFYLPRDLVYGCISYTYSLRDVFHWRMTCRHYRTLIDHLPPGYTHGLVMRRLEKAGVSWLRLTSSYAAPVIFGSFLLQVVLGEEWPGLTVDVLVKRPTIDVSIKYVPYLEAYARCEKQLTYYYVTVPVTAVLATLDFNLNQIYFDRERIQYDGDWIALLRKEGKMWKIDAADYRWMLLGRNGECKCELMSHIPRYQHSLRCNGEYAVLLYKNTALRKQLYERRGFSVNGLPILGSPPPT